MKTFTTTLAAVILLSINACHTKKQSTSTASTPTSSNTETPAAKTTTLSPDSPILARPSNGVYAPGVQEVNAIIIQHADVTLEKLTEGYTIYSKGECINCHGAKNIYRYSETQWQVLVDDMAMRARLTGAQKDAVFKYVLAIKAAKPK